MSTADALPPRSAEDRWPSGPSYQQAIGRILERAEWRLQPVAYWCDCRFPDDMSVAEAERWYEQSCTDGMCCALCGGAR